MIPDTHQHSPGILILAHLKILRPLNVFLSIVSLIITAVLLNQIHNERALITAGLVTGLFTSAGNILNDLFDLKTDIQNRPGRPLVTGLVAVKTARLMTFVCFAAGILVTLNLLPAARWMALGIVLPLLIIYTPVLKPLPLVGNITVAALLGMVFLFGEAALTGSVSEMWIPAGLAFGLTVIRELVKDMEDFEGDRQQGITTFPVRFGFARSVQVFTVLSAVTGIGAVLPYSLKIYGISYFVVLVLGVEIPLIGSIFAIRKHPTTAVSGMIARVLKLATIAGMIAILFSSK